MTSQPSPSGTPSRGPAWPPDARPVPPYQPSRRDRRERAISRWLFSRPAPMMHVLAGAGPIERHNRRLDPQIQLLLAMRRRQGQVNLLHGDTPAQSRLRLRKSALRFGGLEPHMDSVTEFSVPGPGGALRVRRFIPRGLPHGPTPLVVFFHGGGFVACDIDVHDQPCRVIADRCASQVLSVDYRLAPEHPYPAPLEDARAAFAWAVEHAEALGADPARIAVAGDSAGGNLATGTALAALREGAPTPRAQFLIYPFVDVDETRPSRTDLCHDFGLTLRDMQWSAELYTGGDESLRDDPLVVPLHAPSLAGLPPAMVLTAGFDPLRDEGNAYAEALRTAGTHVAHYEAEGMVHGFINMVGVSSAALESFHVGCDAFRRLL